ncbi:MAG: T9SS type A sorting domain-containing protein [Bacteroidia bacterium]
MEKGNDFIFRHYSNDLKKDYFRWMKKIFNLCFLMVAAGNCFSQQITFQKTYGGTGYDRGFSVQQTTDGGYIIAGSIDSSGFDTDVYLVRTDANGDLIWTKTFGGTDTDIGNSVQQTTDGGFIIGGTTYSFGAGYADFYLIKTNVNGSLIWSRTFGGGDDEYGNFVQQTSDGGFIMTGLTQSFGVNNFSTYLIKTDVNGDSLWTRTFSGTGVQAGFCVRQTTDGGYIVTGESQNPVLIYYDVYLAKTDGNGDLLWTKIFGGNTNDAGYSVQQTTDGGYIIAGYTSNFGAGIYNVYLIRTDANGDSLWTKTFGGAVDDQAYSVRQTMDGGFIITGHTSSFGGGPSSVYLIKTDTNGNCLWSRTFGGPGADYGSSVEQTADGGYIIAGQTPNFGAGSLDMYLIKTDSLGHSGCHQGNAATIVTTPATQVVNPLTTVFSGGNVINPPTIVGSGGIVTTLCTTVGISPTPALHEGEGVAITPNPSASNFTITFPNTINKGVIEIYNVLGKKIFVENVTNVSEKEIYLENMGAGIYFVKVRDGEKESVKKLIVQ